VRKEKRKKEERRKQRPKIKNKTGKQPSQKTLVVKFFSGKQTQTLL
jgi:hypothetical protein